MTILVAEDEEDIRNLIEEQLVMEGYTVRKAADGFEALKIYLNETIDLMLLDIMMPKMDGLSVLRKVRDTSDIPVIMVTARGEEVDKVSGLSLGADDYLVKPFGMAELSARVAVQCRHIARNQRRQLNNSEDMSDILTCGEITLNRSKGIITKGEQELSFNAKEYLLLTYLMENQDRVLTKKQIYQAVWGEEYLYDDNTIMVHLSRVRNKIEGDSKKSKYIITFKGIGYKLVNGEAQDEE